MHMMCSMKCPSHTTYAFSSPNSTSKLHFSQDLSSFSGPSRPVPVFTAVNRPRQSRRRHRRGEPLIFFLEENMSNFFTFIIACYYIGRWLWYPHIYYLL